MLLVLKTNDLIRAIELELGTKNRMTAFWVMSKCCVYSSYKEEIKKKCDKFEKWKLVVTLKWTIFKLNIYYLYLGLINYGFFNTLKNVL